jgi:hypothetical protein
VTASLPPPIKKEVVLPKAVAEPIAEPVPQPPAVVAVVAETHSWDTVAAALAAESRLKFGWIASGKFLEKRDHKVLVEFPPSCEAQTETLFWPQARKKIQEALSKNLGEKVELLCSFTGEELPEEHFEEPALPEPPRPREREDISKKPSASSPSKTETSGAPATASTAPALTPEELESFKNDPLIKKALEIFQAEIILR